MKLKTGSVGFEMGKDRVIILQRYGASPYLWIGNGKPDEACFGILDGTDLKHLAESILRELAKRDARARRA